MGIFSELKNRRIVQIVVSYAAAGWIVLTAVAQLTDRGLVPELVYQVALIWYLGGLVASVIIGWYHGEKGRQAVARSEVALLGVVGALTLGWSGATVAERLGQRPDAFALDAVGLEVRRVAVLYFEDAGGAGEWQHVADGLTESLIDRLAAVSGLDVVSRYGAERFRDTDLPDDSIARQLGSGTLVRGRVEEDGGQLRVTVRLIDGLEGSELQRRSVTASAEELFDVREAVTQDVALLLREWLGQEIELQRERRETGSVTAWAMLQRAERARKDGDDLRRQGDLEATLAALERADSLYLRAAALDPALASAHVGRAELALTRARLVVGEDPDRAREWFDEGVRRAGRALALDTRSGEAHEALGHLQYYRWAYGLDADPAERQAAFTAARRDLETAVRLDPSRAEAWSRLSVVRSQEPDNVGAKLAAQRAYEEDTFLRSAATVLWSLYSTSYDLEQFRDAVQYCDEGRRRFPDNPTFVECRLWLLASPGLDPDVDEAWDLLDRFVEMTSPHFREWERMKGEILVGSVLARAQMPDSARAVLDGVEVRASVDPTLELLGYKALASLELGDEESAMEHLRRYLTASPDHREGWRWTGHWWWRDLQDNPEFRELMGLSTRTSVQEGS